MNCRPEDMLLYAVTDRAWLNGETLESQVEKGFEWEGATFVQLRKRSWMRRSFWKRRRSLNALCRISGSVCRSTTTWISALKVDADGVHVGQSDMEAGKVREKAGTG
ncbi:MAG: thiamine phosphate synthase [Clostridium fessum]